MHVSLYLYVCTTLCWQLLHALWRCISNTGTLLYGVHKGHSPSAMYWKQGGGQTDRQPRPRRMTAAAGNAAAAGYGIGAAYYVRMYSVRSRCITYNRYDCCPAMPAGRGLVQNTVGCTYVATHTAAHRVGGGQGNASRECHRSYPVLLHRQNVLRRGGMCMLLCCTHSLCACTSCPASGSNTRRRSLCLTWAGAPVLTDLVMVMADANYFHNIQHSPMLPATCYVSYILCMP